MVFSPTILVIQTSILLTFLPLQLMYPNPRYQGSVTNVSVLSSSQASPSSSSLSSTHSAPSQMITSAPSSARGKDGRVLLAEGRRKGLMSPACPPLICGCFSETTLTCASSARDSGSVAPHSSLDAVRPCSEQWLQLSCHQGSQPSPLHLIKRTPPRRSSVLFP